MYWISSNYRKADELLEANGCLSKRSVRMVWYSVKRPDLWLRDILRSTVRIMNRPLVQLFVLSQFEQ